MHSTTTLYSGEEINRKLAAVSLPALDRAKVGLLTKYCKWAVLQRLICSAADNAKDLKQLKDYFSKAGLIPQSQGQSNENAGSEHVDEGDRFRAAVRVYGNESAITVEADDTRGRGRERGWPTVRFEFASVLNRNPDGNGKTYDWDNKVVFQLGPTELHTAYAVFRGLITKAAFQYHGQARDKSLELLNQPERHGVYVKLLAEKRAFHVPVSAASVTAINHLLVEQIARWSPSAGSYEIESILRRHVELLGQSTQRAANGDT